VALGNDPTWQADVRKLLDIIPGPADLIMMAVKEAFSPDIVTKFGQDQDFPAAILPFVKAQGLSEEWAKKYWAAHWSLPSATQGFEMLHRGVIDEETLKLLLRAQDVMPVWRDNLIQIAYNHLTRVDIRRMHALGILKDEDVNKEYLHAGYSPDHAAALTQLTIVLNQKAQKPADPQLGHMTRGTVLKFLTDGIIDEDKAVALLVTLGETTDAATLYVADTVLNKEHAERRAAADYILAQAEAGELAFEQVETSLLSLGLGASEVQTYLTKLTRKLTIPTKRPSREDADKFIKAGIIDDETYLELVRGAGYAMKWAQAFLILAKGK
jgi:hypothetical protein